ncbi:hypothetical protein MPH_06722 [Macrophomina phaseolina MS6]|uniref:Uncharacterized protein n=1 Tax=Macrophomina phaseolina (strain MS6) TaxID=1126212 RepID=K2RMZ2_MACPH|nr:hypothetical protein MPH_06722 [Macrophomina phaseolina MS6]
MIGTSTREYIFIRACIFLLRAITPACISYCALRFLSPARLRAPVALELWAACETLFFFFFYIPRKQHLQAAAVHPPLASRKERRLLFDRCSSNIPDHARYLRGWFMGAPLSEIKRDNLNEFLAWAFFNTGHVNTIDPDELDEYIREIEKQLGREVEPGRGNARCVRLTIDKVDMSHRSLLWYMVSTKSALPQAAIDALNRLFRLSIFSLPSVCGTPTSTTTAFLSGSTFRCSHSVPMI